MKRMLLALWIVVGVAGVCRAGDIGFIEDFSLAADRAVPLKQLIPGTEDYYYFHALHYQNTGRFDEVEKVLERAVQLAPADYHLPLNNLKRMRQLRRKA